MLFLTCMDQVLVDPQIVHIAPHLRQLCSEGEYRLEAHWAEKICYCRTQDQGTTKTKTQVLSTS